MRLVIDLQKSVKTGTASKAAKPASKTTKGSKSAAAKKSAATKKTSASAKGTRSAAIEKKYPGGHWVTMRGHHVYMKSNGSPATETIPAGMKAAEVKAAHAKAQAKKEASKTSTTPKAKASAEPAKKTKTRVKQTPAMKLGQKEAKDDKVRIKNLEARTKEHKKQNREARKSDKQRALEAPVLKREVVHDGSKPAKEIKHLITQKPDAGKRSAERAQDHKDTAGLSLNRELEKKGKDPIEGVRNPAGDVPIRGGLTPGHFPVKTGEKDPVTGKDTYENRKATLDEIARSHQGLIMNAVTKKMANRYGLQALQREHTWFDANGKPSDLFGDVHQEANLGFLQGVQEYLKDPQKVLDRGVNPLYHAIGRAQDNVKRRMQRILNDVPLPQKFTTPLAVYSDARNKVLSNEKTSQLRGAELREAIKQQIKDSGNLGIIDNLAFDDERNGGKAESIDKKLDMLEGVKRLQRANTRLDQTTDNGEGDKEQSIHEKVGSGEDKDARIIAKERDEALGGALRKFLGDTLSDREAQVVAMKHGVSLKKFLTSDEDAEFKEIAKKLGLGLSNAKKIYYGAMKKLQNAPAEKLDHLRNMLLDKSLVMDLIKSLYMMDLEDFTVAAGLKLEDLQPVFVRRAYGESLAELEKSLDYGEFIGSYASVPAGYVANVVYYELPSDELLIKAFNDMLEKSQGDSSDAVKNWASGNSGKLSALSSQQHSRLSGKSGGMTWSEQLQAENPGSTWITWHGEKILIKGNGQVAYSSGNQAHRDKYHPGESNPAYHHEQEPGFEDQGVAQRKADFEDLKGKWHGSEQHGRGMKHQLSADVNNFGHYLKTTNGVHFQKDVHGNMSDKELNDTFGAANVKAAKNAAMKKMAPGHYELTNPETGKRVVVHLDWKETNRGKDGAPTEGKTAYALELKRAYDPDADVTKRDNKDLQSNRGFLRYMGYNLEPEKGDKEGLAQGKYNFSLNDVKDALGATLRNQANTNYDKHKKGTQIMMKQISAEDFEGQHGQASTTLRDNMAYKLHNIKDVTPKTIKTTKGEADYPGKVFEVAMPNGTTARFDINENGNFSDPIMNKLIDAPFPIHTANDLYTALSNGINNEKWITLSNNEWALGTGMHHHVKVRFDGQGAPVVAGGAFDGMRLQDAAEMANADDKAKSLFKNGKLVEGKLKTTKDAEIPMEDGNAIRYRDGNKWKEGTVLKKYDDGFVRIRKENGDTETYHQTSKNRIRPARTGKQVAAGSMPTVDSDKDGNLKLVAPDNDDVKNKLEEMGVEMKDGRADVSINQLEQIRDKVGGFSLTDAAKKHLDDYFRKSSEDAPPKDVSDLWDKYNPANIDGWRKDSYLHPSAENKTANFSSTQVEGMDHLLKAEKGIAGHGMGTGKTIMGVGAAAYTRDQALKNGQDAGHTLVVSPSGIVPEWLKEIEGHTTLGHVVVGGKSAHDTLMPYKTEGNGKTEQHTSKVVGYDKFNPADHKDKHFHVMSRDTFMAMRDEMGADKFNKFLKDNGYNNAIFDEVHAFKTKGGARNEALKGVSPHVKNVWGLSGTAMDNNVPDIYHLVDAVTGGKHNLGSEKEFNNQYLERQNGKIVGLNQRNLPELGQKLAKYSQFRDGRDVQLLKNGQPEKLSFPEIRGGANHYQGQINHIMDYEPQAVKVKGGEEGETREVNVPKLANPNATGNVETRMTTANSADGKKVTVMQPTFSHDGDLNSHIMARYKQLESSTLSENQRQALADSERSGETGEGSQNYLPAVQRLQQFLNAPLAEHAYFSKAGAKEDGTGGTKQYEHILDANGHRLYRAKDENGNAMSDAKGNPVYLPPMHHYNPKALALKNQVEGMLDNWKAEMQNRKAYNEAHGFTPSDKEYRPLYPPKIAITSQYNDFGKEVIKNVLRDIQHHRGDLGLPLTTGEFSGDNQDTRSKDALAFNSKHTMNDPGHTFMVFSDAGKEGVDMGNAHDLIHYDHDFNAQESAQKSAREIRASSYKHAEREKRANVVGLHTIAVPGTIEDSILRMQHSKMSNIAQVEGSVRSAESQGTKSNYVSHNANSARNFGRNTAKLEKQRSKTVKKSLYTGPLLVISLD